MVKFGKRLLENQYEPWHEHYIDYKRLKKILNGKFILRTKTDTEVVQQANGEPMPAPPLIRRALSNGKNKTFEFTLTKAYTPTNVTADDFENQLLSNVNETKDDNNSTSDHNNTVRSMEELFRRTLDREIEGVVLFFLQEQGEIARKLSFLCTQKQEQKRSNQLDLVTIQNLLLKYNAIGEDILRLIHFVELNVMAVRKILKKHDKIYNFNKISSLYLSKSFSVDEYDSHLNQLYHYGGISATIASLKIAFYELRCHQIVLEMNQSSPSLALTVKDQDRSYEQNYNTVGLHIGSPSRYLQKKSFASNNSLSSMRFQQSPILQPQREEPIITRIEIARKALYQSKEYIDVLASQLMIVDEIKDEKSLLEEDEKKELAKEKYQISSFLNLISTFLYLANYYIVVPTCGQYAEKLGSSASMGGIIIGMTPLAALIASILYGWWSNYSYKSALLFSSLCCIMGDLLYALALHYNSLNMVIIGRYLNGFGSARAINRRYIADTFSRRERTAASAAFVTAGALGMAFGPATAAILGRLPYSGDVITVYTSPGWVMCASWTIYFLLTWIYFEDPVSQRDKTSKTALAMNDPSASMTASHDEKKSLLSNKNDAAIEEHPKIRKPLWKNVPVMSTLWNYFVLKLVLECLLSSSSMLTFHYFGWDMSSSGTLLAILGLLMFPANLIVAKLSRWYDEREMIMGNFYLILFGTLGILHFWNEKYTTIQYIAFAICIFIGTNALEGPNMSLLSKTIPLAWAKGTFNSGLLATEAGTFGRVVGDGFVSLVSFVSRNDDFLPLNGIYIPLFVLVFITLLIMIKFYPLLEPKDDDDDETDDEST